MELNDPLLLKYRDFLLSQGLSEWLDLMAPDGEILNLAASMAGRPLGEALDELARAARRRVHRGAAAEAYASLFGVRDEEAAEAVARHLANWYLEIAEILGVIKKRRL